MSAKRTKSRKRKDDDTEDESDDEDVERAEKRLKTRENRAVSELPSRSQLEMSNALVMTFWIRSERLKNRSSA